MRRGPLVGLIVVIAGFVALTSVIALKTPAWESADEPAHVQNVETLAAGHWYRLHIAYPHNARPVVIGGVRLGGTGSFEAHQPPLYYLLLAGIQQLEMQPAYPVRPGPTSYPFVSHGIYAHHTRADHNFLLFLRMPTILLAALTVFVTFLAARTLTTDPWTPVVAAAFVAFLPRFLFLSAFVTNDVLVNLLGAVLTYVSLRFVQSPRRTWIAAVGATLGLLVITKLSALTVGLVLPLIVFVRKGWLKRGELLVIASVTAAAVCGWYLVQNTVRYGDPLALAASNHYLTAIGGLGVFGPYTVRDPIGLVFRDVPVRIWETFWYSSGWDSFSWPSAVSAVFWSGLVLSLFGLRHRRPGAPLRQRLQDVDGTELAPGDLDSDGPSRWMVTVLVTLTATGFLSVFVVAFTTSSYAARLAFVGLPALACLAGLGLERWRPPTRFLIPALVLVGTLVALQQDVLTVHWN